MDSLRLKEIKVNSKQTLKDQQAQGRRPRFSIIKFIIEPKKIEPIAKINIRNLKIERF